MKAALLIASAVVFVTVLSSQSERAVWVATAAETWTPYVTAPIALGFAARHLSLTRAGLLGALASVLMVVGYYTIQPFHTGRQAVEMTDIYQYGALGLVTGSALAALATFVTRRVREPSRWLLGGCFLVVLNHLVNAVYMGWEVQSVTTSSGVVIIGQDIADTLIAALVVCGFSCAMLAVAARTRPKESRSRRQGV